jgi:hypothetical protein
MSKRQDQRGSGAHAASYQMISGGLFLQGGKIGLRMKLSTHINLLQRLMCGVIPPFPHTPSWRVALLTSWLPQDNVRILLWVPSAMWICDLIQVYDMIAGGNPVCNLFEPPQGNRSHVKCPVRQGSQCLKHRYNLSLGISRVGIAKVWTAQVRFPAVQDFSIVFSVQTGSWAHPASYPMGTGGKESGA